MTRPKLPNAFFAIGWDTDCGNASKFAATLLREIHADEAIASSDRCFEAPGFAVFDLSFDVRRARIHPIISDSECGVGAIFGHIFSTNCTTSSNNLTPSESATILKSRGSTIPQNFWGRYVAFVQCKGRFSVVLDPTAGIPCFYTEQSGVLMVFSHLEACEFINKRHFSINFDFIKKLLAYDKIQTGETGLNEVSELLGGHRLTACKGRREIDVIWDATEFASNPYRGSAALAASELKDVAESVVACWAAKFDSIWVSLSGGLDSTIVLGCVAKAISTSEFRAVHRVLDSEDASELRFAQIAAMNVDCDLTIRQHTPTMTIQKIDTHPASTRPFRTFLTPKEEVFDYPDDKLGQRAVFTGQGGDHLFWVKRSAIRFADYLILKGVDRCFVSELINSARLSGKSIWRVLGEALPVAILGPNRDELLENIRSRRTEITSAIFDSIDLRSLVPDFKGRHSVAFPEKAQQVGAIRHLIHVRRTLETPDPTDAVHPLFSQPLMELCLRIPTPILSLNGVSRGLARSAFANDLPLEIRRRVTKGSATRFFSDKVKQNQNAICEALLDGALSTHGIIRNDDITRFVALGGYRNHDYGHILLAYYSVEAWLRTWVSIIRPTSQITREGIR